MDLLVEAAVKDKITVELKKPGTDEIIINDDGSPMTVTIYGPYSKTYRRVSLENRSKYNSVFSKSEREVNTDQAEEMMFDMLVKCIVDWNITAGGEKPSFSESKAREILIKVPPIKDQLLGKMNDLESFLGNSEAT